MNFYIDAQSVKFIHDFDPEFQSEIVVADFSHTRYKNKAKTQKPLTTGDVVPQFSLLKHAGIWKNIPIELSNDIDISIAQLLREKPLVVSFHSQGWGDYGDLYLDILEKTYQKIHGIGGELLVLTDYSKKEIQETHSKKDLSFSLIEDKNNTVAELFGLYSFDNPIWQRISGINSDVAFPGIYVISQNQVVVYSHINQDLKDFFSAREILNSIYTVKNAKQTA